MLPWGVTLNPEPWALKPETPNPKPQTPNPKGILAKRLGDAAEEGDISYVDCFL